MPKERLGLATASKKNEVADMGDNNTLGRPLPPSRVLTPELLEELNSCDYEGLIVAVSLMGDGIIAAAESLEELEDMILERVGREHPFTTLPGPSPSEHQH